MEDKQYFEWVSDQTYEDSIRAKFGEKGLLTTMKLATGDTSMSCGEEYLKSVTTSHPNIAGLDILFTIDEDEDDE